MTHAAARPTVLVARPSGPEIREIYSNSLGSLSTVTYLEDAADNRAAALAEADVVISFLPHSEVEDDEWKHVRAQLLQVMTSGVDHLRRNVMPSALPIAALPGAQSQAIAEHALAMALAGAKRLESFHTALAKGHFDFVTTTRMLSGGACCIVGLGEMGRAIARLFHAIGMKVTGVSRSGANREPAVAEAVGPDGLDAMIAKADVVVLAVPLNDETVGMIGSRELALMRDDAILVNVARARVIDQRALYRHLVEKPAFQACIDVWWEEPFNQGRFHLEEPFFELPNLLGTPHCASRIPTMPAIMAQRAAENVRDFLATGSCRYVSS